MVLFVNISTFEVNRIMPTIDISSEKPTPLKQLGFAIVILKEVQVLDGEVTELTNPIRISTTLPNGQFFQSYFSAFQYWSNRSPVKRTDIDINTSIHYCQFTELQIESKKQVKFRLVFEPVVQDKLIVQVSKDLDGYTFSLPPQSVEVILEKKPDANPIRNIFISYNTHDDFEKLKGKLEQYILPALTDLSEDELEKIRVKVFVDSISKREIFSFNG